MISRRLFTRAQSDSRAVPRRARACRATPTDANCDYKKAPFFNVLAAFWIQFMTHDWFSHLRGGPERAELMTVGCASQKVTASSGR